MKAKIVWATYDSDGDRSLVGTESNWEEVTQEELQVLRQGLYLIKHPTESWNYTAQLLVDEQKPIQYYLEQIKEAKAKEEAYEKARKDAAVKADKKRKASLAERKRKQFEKLKKEFGE